MAVSVNGTMLSDEKIAEEMNRFRAEYKQYVRREGGEPKEEQLKEWAIENLVEDEVLRIEAAKTQPVPSAERIAKEIEADADVYGVLPESERAVCARETLQKRRLLKEIRKTVTVPSEADLRGYYETHPDNFLVPESRRLSHLCRFVDPASRASEFLNLLRIRKEIESGVIPWAEAVSGLSDTFDRDDGYFAAVARGELPPEIEEKLFALPEKSVSDVIDFGEGTLHLFRVEQALEPQKVGFEEALPTLKDALYRQACDDALHARLDALKAAAVIQPEA